MRGMKPEILGIFSFFVSLIAFLFIGILVFIAASSSSSQFFVSTIVPIVVVFAVVGASLTGLKVYAVERS